MTPPLVSIVTPSYNQAAYLEQTMRSVLEQSYPNVEYLVADGGSTDGSLEIIRKYAGRLAWWVSEPDRGQADGINKGLQRATGEIVAWLNSDDLYRPDALAQVVEFFRVNPEVGLVYSDVESIDAGGERINVMRYGDWGLADLMAFRIIGQPGVFMRRPALAQAGGLDLDYQYLLDHQLWLRIANQTPILHAPGVIWASARYHPGAKNIAQGARFGEEAYRIARWLETDPAFRGVFAQNRRKIWAGAHRFNAFYALDAGLPGRALQAYWKAWWLAPGLVLADWRRVLYALLGPLAPQGLRRAYLERRKQQLDAK
jgi:glycosyltransferase involved in cell wall biosynthesis